ncbi:DnaJ domain [Pseudocohnilembus persalinus]|uniref:DnaJ domain n=1 Tax=Pseudocohnilembus persalinus TaxID=266149 RepID=A0A0V0QTU8_PSEPJ|nr:DnaJ domain [Pseudocohnilembus persalinus]|eukprot:KRX05333.1 DnaJ domain [Pseudocohnilembus persalinus]
MKVPTNFTQSQLKKSYREFMMNTHPDAIQDEQQKLIAQQQYIEIQNINNVLKNPKQKAIYNQFGAVQQAKTKNFNRQNEDKLGNESKIQFQLNEQIQKQNEKKDHNLNNKNINQHSVQNHLEELIQDLEQDNKLEISKKNSKSTKLRKFAQKKTQFILFPVLIYYIYTALFADQPNQIKQFQEQQQQQQQYHNQKYQEQQYNNQQQYQRERRRQRKY